MDERWSAQPNKALKITDMVHTGQDSWKSAGGFDYAVCGYRGSIVPEADLTENKTAVNPNVEQVDVSPRIGSRNDDTSIEFFDTSSLRKDYQVTREVTQIDVLDETLKLQRIEDKRRKALALEIDAEKDSTDDLRLPKRYAYTRHETPVSLHWFSQFNGGIQWLLYETSNGGLYHFYGSRAPVRPWKLIYYVNGSPIDGVAMSRTYFDNPWSGTNFCTFAGRVYMVNGYDRPLVFDGKKCTRAGFSEHAMVATAMINENAVSADDRSKTESSSLGLGHLAFGTSASATIDALYEYKVSFLNERGQESASSNASATVEITNTKTERTMVTVDLPIGPEGTVARRLYRTQNAFDADGVARDQGFAEEFYFVDEIQDNITRFYVDAHPDMNLGALRTDSFYGVFPSKANRIASFKNTLFIANSEESIVKYSSPRMPEEFPVDNELHMGDSISGPISSLYSTKNALVVFKTRGIYLIKGDPMNGFFPFTLSKDTGCIAPKSIKEVPGLGLCFLGREGVFLLQGALENTGTITGVTRIGQPIEETLKRVNYSAAENVRSCINFRDREYWLHVPVDGEVKPNMLLKFHYEIGEWSISEEFRANDIITTEDHRNYVYLACSDTDTTNKGLMVYRSGEIKKGTINIAPLYQTTHLAVGNFYSSFDVVRMQVSAVSYGDNTLNANFVVNRELTDAYSVAKSSKQKRLLEDKNAPVYSDSGATNLDDDLSFGKHKPVPIRYDVTAMHKGLVGEVSFTFDCGTNRMQLTGYQLEVRLGAQREFVTLTEVFGGDLTR